MADSSAALNRSKTSVRRSARRRRRIVSSYIPTTCECGQALTDDRSQCADCAWLDGNNTKEYTIIDAMRRDTGWLSTREIASLADTTPECVNRNIGPLVERGRVLRRVIPDYEYSGLERAVYRLAYRRR